MNSDRQPQHDEHLIQRLDNLTPYALRTLNALPPYQRRIFCALLDLTGEARAAELARETRIWDRGIVSTHLKRLRDKNLVTHDRPYHKVRDRTLIAWYAMRYHRSLQHLPEEILAAVRNTPERHASSAHLLLDALSFQTEAPSNRHSPERQR